MDYYEILGVSKTASNKEIKKSYKKLVKKYHPDVFNGDKSFAEDMIKQINEAYDVLSDNDLRNQYDISLSNDNQSIIFSKDSENYNIPKYEDLYNYNFHKKYTTNYYGTSKSNFDNDRNYDIKDYDFFGGSKSKFLIFIGFTIILILIFLLFLLSSLKSLLYGNIIDNTVNNYVPSENISPYIYLNMSYSNVEYLLGPPDFTETKLDSIYAYWGNSYIVFDKDYFVIDWQNNGDFYSDTVKGKDSKLLKKMIENF